MYCRPLAIIYNVLLLLINYTFEYQLGVVGKTVLSHSIDTRKRGSDVYIDILGHLWLNWQKLENEFIFKRIVLLLFFHFTILSVKSMIKIRAF